MWQEQLKRLDPRSTLQKHPTIALVHGQPRSDHPRAAAIRKDEAIARDLRPPRGRPLGLIFSTPTDWISGDPIAFGPFTVNAGRDEEHLVSFVKITEWLDQGALDWRVHPIGDRAHDAPVSIQGIAEAFRTRGPRETQWRKRTEALPAGTFADDRRGLRLRLDGGGLVMDWFHAIEDDVFSEMKHQTEPMRALMVRHDEPITLDAAWYQADETLFPL